VITFERLGQAGRFGNQLWQVIGTLGLARRLGRDVSLPAWEYARWFNFPDVFHGAQGEDAVGLCGLPPSRAVYMQELSLIEPVAGEVAGWLAPSESAQDALREAMKFYAPEGAVAVHVRRGDYLEGWRGHGVLSEDWYRQVWPDGRVLVFSDDYGWASRLPGEQVKVGEVEDWLLMAACRSHVIANSSYSWWAAFAAGGPTVYPTPWFTGCEFGDMFPERWVGVPRC
jgi:hypothetical protein